MPCQWRPATDCQFAFSDDALLTFDDRRYCPLHLPNKSERKQSPAEFFASFSERLARGDRDFDGVAFPGSTKPNNRIDYSCPHECTFRYAEFGPQIYFVINAPRSDLSFATFETDFQLQAANEQYVICEYATCVGAFFFHGSGAQSRVSFSRSCFAGPAQFSGVQAARSLDFSDCYFGRAPAIVGSGDKVPQHTTINGAEFATRADDEGAFRALRLMFGHNRARDAEGRLYALEKRCHRLALHRPKEWFPRFVSAVYDYSSRYGYSYGLPLIWFCVLQVMFGVLYSLLSGRFGFGGRFDGEAVAFTIAQVVKPFELYGARPISGGLCAMTEGCPHGPWLWVTTIQSVASLTLLALFLLALRWRFRRE